MWSWAAQYDLAGRGLKTHASECYVLRCNHYISHGRRFVTSLLHREFFSSCDAAVQHVPRRPHSWGFRITHTHAQTGRTPLNEWSARRWGCYINNTQQIPVTNSHALSWIRTHDRSNQATADCTTIGIDLNFCY